MTNDGYVISFEDGQPSTIQHAKCGRTSFNPNDIAHRYCGHCHQFLDLFVFDGVQFGNVLWDLIRESLTWPKEEP